MKTRSLLAMSVCLGISWIPGASAATADLTTLMADALEGQEPALSVCESSAPELDWTRLWVRTRVKAGVEIPGIAKVQFVPEVEVLWEKGN